jgi:hypothetical protein
MAIQPTRLPNHPHGHRISSLDQISGIDLRRGGKAPVKMGKRKSYQKKFPNRMDLKERRKGYCAEIRRPKSL